MAEFRGLVLPGRQAIRVLGKDGNVLFEKDDDGMGGRPEVQRAALRQMLIDSLPAGTIRWGHKATGTRALGEGRHEVTFADGASLTTSLLVGADGAWSRVRPLVTDATPAYADTSFVETYLYDADTRHPAAAKAVGGGSMFAPTPGKAIFAHRESGDTLHTYVELERPLDWFADIDFTDAGAAAARIAAEFENWAPELTALITAGDTPLVLRSHHTLPAGLRWDRVPGVTLVGDAAHLAPPNGEGANVAMLDGAELGTALAAHPGNTEAALAEYEQAMFVRAVESVEDNSQLREQLLGDNVPQSLVDLFTGAE
jgi:2-polyprenyl-6-methoxyphenol hydroxylase-like FAD-dependent oxidoreductase